MNEKEFIKYKAEELKKSLKRFPDDFIKLDSGKKVNIPGNTLLVPGKEFFGSMEITTPDGTPVYLSDDPYEGKYIIYSRQNGVNEVMLPGDNKSMSSAVTEYEKYLDLMMKEIGKEYRKKFPEGDSVNAVSGVFRLLNLVRY